MKCNIILLLLLSFNSGPIFCQDLFRVGLIHDFKKEKVVQTFSFDFNRTEKVDEKTDKAIYKNKNFYIFPAADINLGDGVTSSENNILVQMVFGKGYYGNKHSSADQLSVFGWDRSFELNPSYNSNKLFDEKLIYGQMKYMFSYLAQHFVSSDTTTSYINRVSSFAIGPFINNGMRKSAAYDKSEFYQTMGVILEFKKRIQNKDLENAWIIKISGNYYYITSEINELTTDNYGGILKASIDRKIYKELLGGFSYKYGNDNPNYVYVHTLGFDLKYNIK